jgi:secreted trypsin-like serine protease
MRPSKLVAFVISIVAVLSVPVGAKAIINPDPVISDSVPAAVVALHYTGDLSRESQFCSGTLFTPRWVLTAAHCAKEFVEEPGKITVQARIKVGKVITRVSAKVEALFIHPKYEHSDLGILNDVALLRIESRLPGVKPIKLVGFDDTLEKTSEQGFVLFGWGMVNKADSKDITTARRPFGVRQYLRQDGIGFTEAYHFPTLNITSAGSPQNSCYGDSGGPLISSASGVMRVTAVVSYGAADCLAKVPGVSHRVAPVKNWILRVLNR